MSKKCMLLWREAHLHVKMVKAPHGSDHFWKLRSPKSGRLCGAKHTSTTFGSWDVEKVHTVLARSTSPRQNGKKHHMGRTTFGRSDVEKVHAVVARSTFGSQKCQKLGCWAFFNVQISKKCTPTNLTHLTNLTNLTNFTNLTYLTGWTNFTN